ncbi:uncharacterized protein si:ch211-159e12.5 [Silurus meridionalis]|uniref:uncharacterized protein si:ch211-159e12.5 n=1 Tax=Silurus meridionalis TaxID=175797 RepID=UPI001EEB439C|nr:uncharacterized protein si:ch211-159e12.5 [Silurus meridionalis]
MCDQYSDHKMLMERCRERRKEEMMVQRGDLRNHWQSATTHSREERDKVEELAEQARWSYHLSVSRRKRLQGEMWKEIQYALRTEKRSISAVLGQKSGVNTSENTCNLPTSQQLPLYTSVTHNVSVKLNNKQNERTIQSSSWSRPPNYTPPPPYTSPAEQKKQAGTLEPIRSPTNLYTEYRFGSRSDAERELGHRSGSFSDRRPEIQFSSGVETPGTVTFPGPDRKPHHQKRWPSVQQNQELFYTPQSSEHQKKYQTSDSDMTPTKLIRRRSSEGTIFCLVSHTRDYTRLSRSSNYQRPKVKMFPFFKSPVFAETLEEVQALSCSSLKSFKLDPTLKEPTGEHRPPSDQNVRFSKHRKEVRKVREEVRKLSAEETSLCDFSKKKSQDKNNINVPPAESLNSTTLVEPHHQTSLKFPLWKEPRSQQFPPPQLSQHCSNRSFRRGGLSEQPELINTTMTDQKTGLVLIDKSNVVIKLDILIPPKPEHIQYTSSQPSDSSKHNSDSNHQDKTSEQTTDRSSEQKLINQTSSQVQPKHKTSKKRAERILGIVLQNSVDEEHTLKESFKMENSSLSQGPDPSERSSEGDNPPIPATSTPNEEENSNITSEAEAMLEISEVTHGDDVNAGHEIVEMRSTEWGADLKSDDKKFMTDEIHTSVTDLRDEHVKNSSIGERDDFQNLNQTFLRNTSDAFSQKNKIIEEKSFHGADERKDLTQAMLRRSVENTTETFSQEYFMGKFLNVTVDHNENFSDPLAETADVQNHVQILQNIYERDTNKAMDHELRPMEENPFCTFHNLQRTSDMFSLEGGHHQENLLHVQNLCPNFLNTSETLQQEINQQFSNQRGSEVSPSFLGYHVEKTNNLFAHQENPENNIS